MLSNPSCTPKADYSGVKERKHSRERARDNVSRTWGETGGGGGGNAEHQGVGQCGSAFVNGYCGRRSEVFELYASQHKFTS